MRSILTLCALEASSHPWHPEFDMQAMPDKYGMDIWPTNTYLEVGDQSVTPAPRKVFSYNNSHQLQFLAVRGHCISWYHPSAFPQLMGYCKLVIHLVLIRIESASYER